MKCAQICFYTMIASLLRSVTLAQSVCLVDHAAELGHALPYFLLLRLFLRLVNLFVLSEARQKRLCILEGLIFI